MYICEIQIAEMAFGAVLFQRLKVCSNVRLMLVLCSMKPLLLSLMLAFSLHGPPLLYISKSYNDAVQQQHQHTVATQGEWLDTSGVLKAYALSAGGSRTTTAIVTAGGSGRSSIYNNSELPQHWSFFSDLNRPKRTNTDSASALDYLAASSSGKKISLTTKSLPSPVLYQLHRASPSSSATAFVGGLPAGNAHGVPGQSFISASLSNKQQHQSVAANVKSSATTAVTATGAATATARTSIGALRSSSSNSSGGCTLDGEPIGGPLTPLRGMVLLQRREAQQKSAGGVILPSESKGREVVAKVLAVGPGEPRQQVEDEKHIPIDVAPGDWAIISRHSYDSFQYNENECLLVSATDILAKVKENTAEDEMSPQNLLPLGDTVLVKLLKQPERTASGLYLQSQNERSRTIKKGQAISVGPGKYDKEGKRIPTGINAGVFVVFPQYAQDEPDIKYGSDFYTFIKAADIIAQWES